MLARCREASRRLARKLADRVVAQFGHPRGFWGSVAGWTMALRSSNRRRNAWAVSLLDVRSHDRVLEIGFGPGIAVREIGRIATEGFVCGVDRSERMLRQASRRNAAAIAAGRVELRLGSVEDLPAFAVPFDDLPAFAVPFDRILAVNTVLFWQRPASVFEELRRLLRPGGRIAVAHQPRGRGATGAAASAKGEEIAAALARAGFSDVQTSTLELRPPVVCVTAVNPPVAAPEAGGESHAHRREG